jgi:hypothetical protein
MRVGPYADLWRNADLFLCWDTFTVMSRHVPFSCFSVVWRNKKVIAILCIIWECRVMAVERWMSHADGMVNTAMSPSADSPQRWKHSGPLSADSISSFTSECFLRVPIGRAVCTAGGNTWTRTAVTMYSAYSVH